MHSVRFSSNLWHVYPLVPASLLLVPIPLPIPFPVLVVVVPLVFVVAAACCCYLLLGLRLTVVTLASWPRFTHFMCAQKPIL